MSREDRWRQKRFYVLNAGRCYLEEERDTAPVFAKSEGGGGIMSSDVLESHSKSTTKSSSSKGASVQSAVDFQNLVKVSLSITPILTDEAGISEGYSVSYVTNVSLVPEAMRSLSEWLITYPILLQSRRLAEKS